MLALSTSWNAHRHTDGELLLREIQGLGFDAVSLGHGVKPSLLAGMKRVIAKGQLAAVAAEGFFPAPKGYSAGFDSRFHLTASDPSDRQKALELTLHTLDYAADLGVRIVLLPLGSIRLKGLTDSLARLAADHRIHSRSYVRLKLAGITQRNRATRRLLERVRQALDKLAPAARATGMRLGLVARGALEAIPTEEEMKILLTDYREGGPVGYWHDFGAIQVKANLGFLSHDQWLRQASPWLLGGYVHDTAWPDRIDRLPFSGMIAYRELLPLLPRGIPLAWRIPATSSSPEICQALLAWKGEFSLAS